MKIPNWVKWLARDEDGDLYGYEKEPIKEEWENAWYSEAYSKYWFVSEENDYFKHIQWTDEKPYCISPSLKSADIGSKLTEGISAAIAHGFYDIPNLSEIPNSSDMVNHPPHYKQGEIEVIDIMRLVLTEEEFAGYCKGNVLKYSLRAPFKGNADEDWKKAKWYYEKSEETK